MREWPAWKRIRTCSNYQRGFRPRNEGLENQEAMGEERNRGTMNSRVLPKK